jgi:hypothetical protein
MSVSAYRRVAPIVSTSSLFLDAHEPPPKPTRRYADPCSFGAKISRRELLSMSELQASLRDELILCRFLRRSSLCRRRFAVNETASSMLI